METFHGIQRFNKSLMIIIVIMKVRDLKFGLLPPKILKKEKNSRDYGFGYDKDYKQFPL